MSFLHLQKQWNGCVETYCKIGGFVIWPACLSFLKINKCRVFNLEFQQFGNPAIHLINFSRNLRMNVSHTINFFRWRTWSLKIFGHTCRNKGNWSRVLRRQKCITVQVIQETDIHALLDVATFFGIKFIDHLKLSFIWRQNMKWCTTCSSSFLIQRCQMMSYPISTPITTPWKWIPELRCHGENLYILFLSWLMAEQVSSGRKLGKTRTWRCRHCVSKNSSYGLWRVMLKSCS